MAAEAVLTNISEMIDLAIGTPEVGVVDFCMLQSVLHCLAQQLRVQQKNVELRGSAATLPVGRLSDSTPAIAITEFIVDTEAPGGYELAPMIPSPDQETMLVVERVKKMDWASVSQDATSAQQPGQGAKSGPGGGAVRPGSAGVRPGSAGPGGGGPGGGGGPAGGPKQPSPQAMAPPGTTPSAAPQTQQGRLTTTPSGTGLAPERLSLVTLSKFNLLESTVEDLKNRVYGSVPKNEELLQEVRSQSNLKAITDMWTNMNVQSRLDAAEEGIGRLSSLIQDLIGETVELQKATGSAPSAATDRMAQQAKAVSDAAKSPRGPPSTDGPGYGPPQGQQAGQGPQAAPGGVQGKGAASPGGETKGPGGVTVGPDGVPVGPGGVPYPPGGGYAPGVMDSQGNMTMPDMSWVASRDDLMNVMDQLDQLRSDLNYLTETFHNAMKEVNAEFVPPPPPPQVIQVRDGGGTTADSDGGGGGGSGPGGGGAGGGGLAKSGKGTAGGGPGSGGSGGGGGMVDRQQRGTKSHPQQMVPMPGMAPTDVLERLNELEKQLKKCCETITKSEGLVNDQLTSFQDQLEYLSKQVACVSLDLGTGKLSPDLVKDLQGLMQLFQTVQEMQTQLQEVHETALHLATEKEERQSHIDALLEQIELLKAIKLDREDMVEALADKADLRMLARKVSHDQFETACDDLSKGLEHALGKLNVQEALWQQALDDIQREIETKLDKMELSPVKEFFNNKLKQLQENLKQMAALRREAEAAGTKRRLLRDVNCISCDAKAVMSMDPPPHMPPKPLPGNLSMKPYLSYELDAIRKSQASSLPQRNMHDWEHIDKQMQPKQPHKMRSETDKHLCNRYCGGSHTVTTPAQRVARLGHFIKQWGPEVLPLSSGFAAGDDGRLYKVSAVEGANVGPGGAVDGAAICTPKSPVKKVETPKGPKPIIISAECRCLDPATNTKERPSKG